MVHDNTAILFGSPLICRCHFPFYSNSSHSRSPSNDHNSLSYDVKLFIEKKVNLFRLLDEIIKPLPIGHGFHKAFQSAIDGQINYGHLFYYYIYIYINIFKFILKPCS